MMSKFRFRSRSQLFSHGLWCRCVWVEHGFRGFLDLCEKSFLIQYLVDLLNKPLKRTWLRGSLSKVNGIFLFLLLDWFLIDCFCFGGYATFGRSSKSFTCITVQILRSSWNNRKWWIIWQVSYYRNRILTVYRAIITIYFHSDLSIPIVNSILERM